VFAKLEKTITISEIVTGMVQHKLKRQRTIIFNAAEIIQSRCSVQWFDKMESINECHD